MNIKNSVKVASANSKYFKSLLFKDIVSSTQTIAKEELMNYNDEFLVVALTQTDGVGRFKRNWDSPNDKGFYGSFVFRPNVSREKLIEFNLFIALAITKTLESFIDYDIKIKWPNDIYIKGKKVCGFLTEMIKEKEQFSIICGIGINLFHEKSEVDKKESIERFANDTFNVKDFVNDLIHNIEKYYELFLSKDFKSIRNEYISYSVVLGNRIKITTSSEQFYAKAIDIDDNGILVVINDDGHIKRVISADIEE